MRKMEARKDYHLLPPIPTMAVVNRATTNPTLAVLKQATIPTSAVVKRATTTNYSPTTTSSSPTINNYSPTTTSSSPTTNPAPTPISLYDVLDLPFDIFPSEPTCYGTKSSSERGILDEIDSIVQEEDEILF